MNEKSSHLGKASSAPGPVSADGAGRAKMKHTAEPCSNHKQKMAALLLSYYILR